jgi:hypothetical protein
MINDLACCDTNLFAATNNGIFLSTDYGKNWAPINYNMPDISPTLAYTSLAVCGNNLFASINNFSVTMLANNSNSWIDYKAPFLFVGELKLLGDRLFEGSVMNAGIAYTILPATITSVYEIDNTPVDFSLDQNYPNPFNPSTKISWQLPVSSQTTLKVYDIMGREVETLINEFKPAGKYETEFNAALLPSGVYFYQIKAGDFLQTKKMILLK